MYLSHGLFLFLTLLFASLAVFLSLTIFQGLSVLVNSDTGDGHRWIYADSPD